MDAVGRRVTTFAGWVTITASAVHATPLYFDVNGTLPGSGVLPSTTYTWTSSAALWNADPGGMSDVQTWTPSATAVFSAGADATGTVLVVVRNAVAVDGILVEEGNVTLNVTGAGSVSLAGGPIDVPDGGRVLSVKCPIGGTTLTKTGAGMLILGHASNTFTGGVAVNGGTLQFAGENVLTGASPSRTGMTPTTVVPDYMRLDGGVIQDTNTLALAVLLNSNKGITLGAAGGTIDIADTSTTNPHAYGGVISGPGSLTKAGPGVLQLGTQPSTYGGATVVSQGVLRISAHNVLPTGTAATVAAGATLDLGLFNQTVSALSGAGKVTANTGRLTVAPTADTTWSGVVSGTAGLTAAGPAFLVLGAAQTYTGPTVISGASAVPFGIRLGTAGAIIPTSDLQFNAADASSAPTLDLNGFALSLSTITNLHAGVGHPAITNTSSTQATLTLNNTAAAIDIPISGSIAVTKTGTATLMLTAPNTYSGPTRVNAGIVAVSNAAQLGNGGPTNGIILDGGTLRTDAGLSMSRGLAAMVSGGKVDTNGFDSTVSGPVTGVGTLTKLGAGTLTLGPLSLNGLVVSVGQARLAPGAGTSTLGSLAVAAGAKFDAADNRLVLTGLTPAAVASMLAAGRIGTSPGDWQGVSGIASSAAAADPGKSTAIGYATAFQLGVTAWGTATGLTGAETLTKYTYYGDLNLDGKVNADDYARIDRYLAKGVVPGTAVWIDGDVNYDRAVTAADYLLLDRAFALHGGVLSPAMLAQRESRFGSEYVTYLVSSVPEPALPAVAAMTLLLPPMRRRR